MNANFISVRNDQMEEMKQEMNKLWILMPVKVDIFEDNSIEESKVYEESVDWS